ncbi:MAG: ribbon-helix-helix domain-containing protein [Solirubrobacteraceae bacterium]|nr:ribbon-helix-helix domain-containing protein [Solirubrobacteraceae bacterium]
MRTTVTLDPDTRALIERAMRERGRSFKEALNDAIRAGLAPRSPGGERRTSVRDLGVPRVDLTHALEIADRLEDDVLSRRLVEGR